MIPALPPIPTDRKGRPTLFTPILAERFCQLIGEGNSWVRACAKEGMPSTRTIMRWLAIERDGEEGAAYDAFRLCLARAYEKRADLRGERVDSYIRQAQRGAMDPPLLRALVEAQRVMMEIESPRRYGKALTLKGSSKEPLRVTRYDVTDEQLMALAAQALEKS